MNEFESDWISLSQNQSGVRVFLSESERRKQGVWIQHGRIQDGSHHQVESEWMNEVFLCKMAESKMAEFKMAAIISWVRMNEFEPDWISLSQNQSGVRVFLSESKRRKQGVWIQHGRIQDGSHHQVESEWMNEVFLYKMVDSHDGRIQDGCHHQVDEIELVWVRVRVEWECFWVNLREDNKVSESKMAVSESNMAEFKMAAIIKLSQNEWMKVFLCANGGN